ncbi:MAG: zinc dependent phospholipase C family protein [Oscillibacter sp.]|nr:zinc dependent phospholipase C family protein [Oscillibacter sp.]
MQKRSHKLLAHTLLTGCSGFDKRRFELAFLFGSFEPDCNPLSYLKGSIRGEKFRGHNFSNSQRYIHRQILRLQNRSRWSLWQYYTLGKLTHYLADAFTFPHNETYQEGIAAHREYESRLRGQFAGYLEGKTPRAQRSCADVFAAIDRLHRQYLRAASDRQRDIRYILAANGILLSSVLPQIA